MRRSCVLSSAFFSYIDRSFTDLRHTEDDFGDRTLYSSLAISQIVLHVQSRAIKWVQVSSAKVNLDFTWSYCRNNAVSETIIHPIIDEISELETIA